MIILEVGMGGRYDATNILDLDSFRSYACGITLLDYDHTRVLGNLLEQIAWEKGGIFQIHKGSSSVSPRPNGQTARMQDNDNRPQPDGGTNRCRFFALDSNKDSAVQVLRQCAWIEGEERLVQLVGGTKQGSTRRIPVDCSIGLPGEHQRTNAELAVALCEAVMAGEGSSTTQAKSSDIFRALETATWPGRCQTVNVADRYGTRTTLRLDGAHTVESMAAGLKWYQSVTSSHGSRKDSRVVVKILLFNCSHERNPVELLQRLIPLGFRSVYFCRADSERPSAVRKKTAAELLQQSGIPFMEQDGDCNIDKTWQDTLASVWQHLEKETKVFASASTQANLTVAEVLAQLPQKPCTENECVEALVTGSLYLVGSALAAVNWRELESEGRITETT